MKCLLLFVLVFATGFWGNAQKPAETKMYSGRIINGQGDGVEYATVVLLQYNIQKTGTTTDDKGNFSMEAKAGTYEAVVQCIGYKTIHKNVTLPAPTPDTFSLQASSYALKEVVVQAKNIERKADRFVISVSPSMGKDGTELLSQAPDVWLADNTISINGAQGSVTMGTAQSGDLNRYEPSATLHARIGKWTVNAAASTTFTPKDKSEITSSREYTDSDSRFSNRSDFDIRSNYGTGRLGAIFEIDTLNSIGAEIEYIGQVSKGGSNSRTELIKGGFPVHSTGDYYQENDYNTFSATANYLRKIDNKGSLFKVIVDYANKASTGKNDYHILQKIAGKDKDSIYRNNAAATYDIVTSDISVRKSLGKGLSLNAGLKYTYTFMDDNSCYENQDAAGQWSINPAYGYTLRYNENIAGAYASFSADLNRWSLTAGLRGEYTRTSNRSDHLNEDYLDLFPNLNVTYAFNNLKTWMLVGQYARNIERPAFYTLNPNRLQTSDYSYNIGNPYLKPTYINRFSATLVYNYRYTLTIGGNLHHDLIREFCKKDATDPDVSYITYENHDIENHWFVAANIPLQPVRWCNLAANYVGVIQAIRMTKDAGFANHFLSFANVTASFILPKDLTLEAQYNGASRLYSGNSEVAPRHTVSLFARKKLANDRLLVTLSANNIFNRYNDYVNNMAAYTALSHYETGSQGRTFKVSLTWNFNSGKKIKKQTIERGSHSERSRLNEK